MNTIAPSDFSATQRNEIIFIESNVSNFQNLVNSIEAGREVHILDAVSDGLAQMAQILAGRSGIDAIHLISHGATGSLQLGSNSLTTQNLATYGAELTAIGSALKPGGDILLYGCSAAQGEAGTQLIGRLAQATGADIAASTDLTGAAAQGGDWQLEYASGDIETAALSFANYESVLAAPVFRQPSGTFGSRVDYYAGSFSGGLSSTDINGDGKVDLIVAGFNTISVLTNNGDGSFAHKVDYAAGDAVQGVTSADVNGDNKPDLIAVNSSASTVSVLNNNGNGTFAPAVAYATGSGPESVISADANGDGYADLIVTNASSDTVSVLMNNGVGGFANKVDYATGRMPWRTATADVNGDGKTDLIVTNHLGFTASVLMGNGDGSFADKVDYWAGLRPFDITTNDVNGDGKADLIVTDVFDHTASVLTNNGDGTFAFKVDYAMAMYSYPNSVTSADVNSDLKPDLIVASLNHNTVSVLTNNGDGTFSDKIDYATGSNTRTVISADVNGDGKMDLIASNSGDGTVSVLLNAPAPSTPFIKQTPVTVTSTLTLTDPDGDTDWNGGQLKIQITANSEAYYDTLGLPSAPQAGNSIWLSPVGYIMADMTPIGTANTASALGGDAWVLTFNRNATNALVQDVVRAVVFFNNNETPSSLSRTVTFTATDAGGLSASAEQTITVSAANAAALTYSPSIFTESTLNDGSIVTSSLITLSNETFTGNDGDDWSPNVHNVPAGLIPKLIRNDATHATLSFTGQAAAHANADDFNNLTVSFSDWQFSGGSAATVTGATTTNLTIDFTEALAKALTYSATTFVESAANDGSITTTSTISLTNDTFTGMDGDDWSPNVHNVPAGLTPKLIRDDATHATLSFTGQAAAHANADDVNNLTVTFSDWQFTGGSAATVAGATTTNLAVDFAEPLPKTLTYSATTFVESAANDGSITATSTITLNNDTFTGSNGENWSSIVTNVPAGLTASLIRTDATHATLSFTGQAAAHTNANDLVNLAVNFDNTKFTGGSAVEVTGAATNNLSIDFTDPPVNHAPTIGQPMFATKLNYGAGPTRVISADVNSDGKADLIATGRAVSVLINTGDGIFADKVDYAAGASPEDIISTDVNGDGKADLIVENTSYIKANTVSVLINNGDGSFAAKVNYNTDDGTGFETGGITSADVNSDGKPDLLVTHKASDQLSVLINNGDGSFAPKVDYAAGWRSRYITSADVNNDGTPDLIMANGGRFVSVLINNGTGSFVDKVDYEVGGDAWDATSADANGDGKADLIVVHPFDNTLSVLINNGDGSFADKIDYATGQFGHFPVSVTSADVNGDGTADLIVANREGQTVSVLAGRGDGSFAAKTEYAVELSPQDVTSADVDGDGKPDLIVTGYSTSGYTVAVLLNSPVTAFNEQTPVTVSNTFMVSDPDGDAAWSGGRLKIQITANSEANDSLSLRTTNPGGNAIWLDTTGNKLMAGNTQIGTADASSVSNGSAWTFTFDNDATNALVQDVARAVRFYNSSDTPGTGNRTVSFTVTDSGMLSASATQVIAVTPVKKLTFSATSFVEAAANDGSITTSSTITLINDTFTGSNGDNWSAIVSNVPAGLTASLIRNDATHATLSFTGQAAAHGNADDKLDLTVTFDNSKFAGGSAAAVTGATTTNLAMYFAEPALTTFSGRVDYTTGANAHGLLSIDVNNDGKIDLVNANYEGDTVSVLLGNGDGSFSNKVEYATGSKARGLTSADVNGDGKVDLVVTNADSDSVSVLINNGNGSFAGKVDFATGDRPYGITSADVNNDGKADLIVANQWSDNISVLFGNGNGSFANKIDYTVGGEPVGVASADVNNDGKVDLIVSNRESSTVSVFINNGNGTFAARRDYATGMGPTGVVIADVNGDGNGDLITANVYGGPQYGGTVSVLAGLGDGNFGPMVEYKLTNYSSPYFLTVADVNGDAKPDLILPNSARGTIAVLSNIGDGSFSKEIEYAVGIYPLNIASADFNGDGTMDLVVGHYLEWDYTDAKLSVLLNTQDNSLSPDIDGDGITNATENSVPGLGHNGISPILGDGNGDGIRDSSQNEITSVPFLGTSTAVSNPGNAPALYVTLVADAQAGLVDTTDGNSAVLTQLKQLDAPADKPANIDMPLGLISFVADVGTPGVTETFSLFVDHSIPVNGYFKKNAAGDWVNIATSVVDLYSKTRVDFAITDGGEFDTDGLANGIITDPGAIGFQARSLSFGETIFVEAAANIGSITTSSVITLVNESFTGNAGDDWSSIVGNVPAGLTAKLIRNDATHATLSFTGQAAAHANANDIDNLTVIFDNSKFTGGSAASISGATTSNLLVDFADPAVNTPPTGTVTITGTATQGQTLTASNDLEDADGPAILTVTYQWQADGSAIVGATASTLLLDQTLVGKTITVVASYLDAFNTAESQTSLATAAVTNSDDAATGTLRVTGTAAEGASLLADLSDVLDSDGSTSTSYRWQEEIDSLWTDIDGASEASLSIPADQSFVGKSVRVVATALDALGGTTEFISDAQTIANINDAPTGSPADVLPDGAEDTTYTVSAKSLLAGFADIDGDSLLAANLTADHASVTGNEDGTWSVTPASNFNGQLSLSYEVIDGHGGSLAATQSFSLLAVDDVAVVDSADVIIHETNAPLMVTGVLSISDIDSPASFVAQPGSAGKYGIFTLGTDGAWSYKANLAYDYLNVGESVKDSFQVKASDGTASSVRVTIAGTADTTSVHLGDAPVSQSGTGGQWAQAWTQSGYSILHKADHTNGAEAWSVVKLSGVSSQLLTGGDIYAGDLGVSGQSVVTSTVKQEIDGKEALRVNLPTQADSVTLKLSNLFKNDDGSAMSESGLLRLLDSTGQVVAEQAFFADAASGAKTVTLAATAGFTSLELIAGAYNSAGAFNYGAYSTAAGAFGGALSTDSAGKFHGSEFLVDSMDFVISLVGVA